MKSFNHKFIQSAYFIFSLFIVTSFARHTFAQESSLSQDFIVLPKSALPIANTVQQDADYSLTPQFVFEQLTFISANERSFDRSVYSQQLTATGLSLHSQREHSALDFKWFYVDQEKFHYFDVPELSRRWQPTEGTQIVVGRHLHQWSHADSFWGTGRWQSRFLWDYFEPHEQGLTGLFYKVQVAPRTRFNLFVSGIFAPDFSPKYREENGQIISRNPWFHPPPQAVTLWGKDTQVSASVDEPSITEVIYKPSLALQVTQELSRTVNMQAAYSYKPMNQARLGFDYYLLLPSVPTNPHKVVVDVKPEYLHAQVATLEAQIEVQEWSIVPSVTYENPDEFRYSELAINQNFEDTTLLSLVFERKLGEPSQKNRTYIGFMKLYGGRELDLGENASQESFFNYREWYYTAYRVGLDTEVAKIKRKAVRAKIEGTYDSSQKGGMLLTQANMQLSPQMHVGFKMNWIGVLTSQDTGYERGFFHVNRVNDNLGLELQYVF